GRGGPAPGPPQPAADGLLRRGADVRLPRDGVLPRHQPGTGPFPRPPAPVRDAVDIALGVLGALDALHTQGFVHRDVKPANVLIASGAEAPGDSASPRRLLVKLADLGLLAPVLGGGPGDPGENEAGLIVGTPAYLAPEQARGAGRVDGRADLYSLGCTLFESL